MTSKNEEEVLPPEEFELSEKEKHEILEWLDRAETMLRGSMLDTESKEETVSK